MWNNFTAWAKPVLQEKVLQNKKFQTHNATHLRQELYLQLLEIHLSSMDETESICDFAKYRFHRISKSDEPKRQAFRTAGKILREHHHSTQKLQQHQSSSLQIRLVFTIVAFQDLPHLRTLVESIWMPQHLIIIHLERYTDAEFQRGLQEWIATHRHYNQNVLILQFGSIVYETDSVSQINLEIMDWLHNAQGYYEYDYHITLGGAAFPLFSAQEMNDYLYKAKLNGQEVWLGELLHKGQRVHHPQAMLVWNRKRLYTTAVSTENTTSPTAQKMDTRVGKIISAPVPNWLDKAMQFKSTSGNQGIYNYRVVSQLIQNHRIKQMFAMAKYGCCCCLEERTWIAAMDMLELLHQAKENYSMFQVWGRPAIIDQEKKRGKRSSSKCEGGMKNSVLELNDYPHACYKSEHTYLNGANMMNASQVMEGLVQAKKRGILFARKFHSDNPNSVHLRDAIVRELHRK
jgi:hypothetical protein